MTTRAELALQIFEPTGFYFNTRKIFLASAPLGSSLLIRYRGYMSCDTSIFKFCARSLLCTLLSCCLFSQAANADVVEANTGNNFRGWTFKAIPDVSQAGEAPITGIADPSGGSASLNFTLTGEMGNKRVVKLRQKDFAAAGLTGITKLSDLTSVSWRIHHSDPLTYPRFAVTLRAKPNVEIDGQWYTYKKYETIRFIPKNQKLTPGEWDTVTVDFTGRGAAGSLFRHSGPLDDKSPINPGTHQKKPINQWILGYGDLEIHSIQWAYGSKDNALTFTSYIDSLEINGKTFDF